LGEDSGWGATIIAPNQKAAEAVFLSGSHQSQAAVQFCENSPIIANNFRKGT
jgi:hypothetical protein